MNKKLIAEREPRYAGGPSPRSRSSSPISWLIGDGTIAGVSGGLGEAVTVRSPIAAWLGHADPAFTLRTYVHSRDQALKDASRWLQRTRDVEVTSPEDPPSES